MKSLTDYTDAELMAMNPQDQAALAQQYQHAIQQKQTTYNQSAILDKLSDKDLIEIQNNRPAEAQDLSVGRIPPSLMKEEFNPDIPFLPRWKLKNFGPSFGGEGTPAALDFIKNQLQDEFKTIQQDGRIFVQSKLNEDKNWYPLDSDPTSNLPKLITTFGAPTAAGTILGTMTGGPGGMLKGAIAGATAGVALAKDQINQIDWKAEKKNLYNFFRDMPQDVTDAVWDTFVDAPIETMAGVYSSIAGMHLGIPQIAGALGTSVAGGLVEGAREAIGNAIGIKQKLNNSDVLMGAATGGLLSYLVGAKPSAKFVAEKLGPKVDKITKEQIPALRMLANPDQLSDSEKQGVMDLVPFADNFQDAGNQILQNARDEATQKYVKEAQGTIPSAYDLLTRDATTAVAGKLTSTPPQAYLNYMRNPKRMLELDANSGKFAGETGKDLLSFANEQTSKTGHRFGDFLQKYEEKRVDLSNVVAPMQDRIIELANKRRDQGLLGQEQEELNKLSKIYNDFFINTTSNGNSVPRNLLMTPYEAKDFKNEFGKYARWDVVDKSTIQDPVELAKMDVARSIYFDSNKAMENAFANDPKALQELVSLRKKNEVAHLQEDFMRAIFPGKPSEGNLLFDQSAYNVLSNPTAKTNVVLTDFVNSIDKSKGLKGSDSYLQKMNDLYSHSYLGDPGSGGYTRWAKSTQGAGTVGSLTAGALRGAGLEGQMGYGIGRTAGLQLIDPKTMLSAFRGGQSAEQFIAKLLDFTGRKKYIGQAPVSNLQIMSAGNLAAPQIQSAWGNFNNTNNNTNYIEQANY